MPGAETRRAAGRGNDPGHAPLSLAEERPPGFARPKFRCVWQDVPKQEWTGPQSSGPCERTPMDRKSFHLPTGARGGKAFPSESHSSDTWAVAPLLGYSHNAGRSALTKLIRNPQVRNLEIYVRRTPDDSYIIPPGSAGSWTGYQMVLVGWQKISETAKRRQIF